MVNITAIEGIGDHYAKKLRSIGISTVEELLEKGSTPAGRNEIVGKCGIGARLILRWVNHADLFRIRGIASQFAELLEASGVETVAELAQRNPEHLYLAMIRTNEQKRLVRVRPPHSRVLDWVAQAKALPRIVKYH